MPRKSVKWWGFKAKPAEILQAIASPEPLPALHARTVVEVLGPRPTSAEIRVLGREVAEALARVREEQATGQLGMVPTLVRGRPLALWLPLDEVAAWLGRVGRERGATR